MAAQREFFRYLLVACAPLLVWFLHFAVLYGALSAVPGEASCAPAGLEVSVWSVTIAAGAAIVLLARRAVLWRTPPGRELRLVRIAAVANAVLAMTAVAWSAAAVVLQVQWCS